MREPSGDQAGDPTYPSDLAISRGVPPLASTTYKPRSAAREKTTFVPSGENEPRPLWPSLVRVFSEPSEFMTQSSHSSPGALESLRSASSRRLPSRDQAIGVRPCDGPRQIGLAGSLGSTAQISDL